MTFYEISGEKKMECKTAPENQEHWENDRRTEKIL